MASESKSGDEQEAPRWRRQVDAIVETQIARSPFLVQGRAVWRQLEHERESWPLLIPFVIIAFAYVYLRERRKVFITQRDLRD